jgi:hypothetical protein
MKFTEKDLNNTILDKLNRLDSIINSPSKGEGFVIYDGTFKTKVIPDTNLRRVFSENELTEIESFGYIKNKSYQSAFLNSELNYLNKPILNFRKLSLKLNPEKLFSIENEIVLSKKFNNIIFVLDNTGKFYEYDLEKKILNHSFNLINELKMNFSIDKIYPFDFLDILYYDKGFLISTKNNGVIYVNVYTKALEVKFSEDNIIMMRNLGNGNILLAANRSTNNLIIYNFKTELKVEIWNQLRKLGNQFPEDIFTDEKYIAILGKYYSTEPAKNLLHIWEKNEIEFSNIDSNIYPGTDNYDYYLKGVLTDTDHIYVYGLKGLNLFIWKYNKNNLYKKYEEIMFDNIKLNHLNNNIIIKNNKFIIPSYNKLYAYSLEKKISMNIELPLEIISVYGDKEDLIVIGRNDIVRVIPPKYEIEKSITIKIPSVEKVCNNINIIIQGRDDENIVFIDEDTLKQIIPEFYLIDKERTIIKLKNANSNNILMKISLAGLNEINNIIINYDNIYIK